MARRRKGDPLGIAIYFIISILAVILYVVGTALMLIATIAFYAVPFVLAACFWRMHGTSASPPVLPDPAEFDHHDMTMQVRRAFGRITLLKADIRSQHQVALAQDVRLTKASGERRFDTRSNLGRRLNERLDHIEKEIGVLEDQVAFTRRLVAGTSPNWRDIIEGWRIRRSFQVAVWCSVISSSFALLLLLTNRSHPDIRSLQGILLWIPPEWSNLGPYVGAAMLGYPIFFAARYLQYRHLRSVFDSQTFDCWKKFEAKWVVWDDPLFYFPPLIEEAGAEGQKAADRSRSDTVHGWASVLGVSENAEPSEIKAAYRDLMKGYHSDRVAGLGIRLREVAEEESKRINIAYDEAKALKDFQ